MPSGARQLQVTSAPYHDGDSAWSAVGGYTTNAVYAARRGTSSSTITAFYRERLAGWAVTEEEIPVFEVRTRKQVGAVQALTFRRGASCVSVGTNGFVGPTPRPTFEIVVDHAGADEDKPRRRRC